MRALSAVLLVLASAPSALADVGTQPAWLADPSVLAMSSITLDAARLRALVTTDGQAQALVLERFDRSSNTLTSQRLVDTFESGGYAYTLSANATGFDGISFQGTTLAFALYTRDGGDALRCEVDSNDPRLVARCADAGLRRPSRRPPAHPSWATQPAVIAACDLAIYDSNITLQCIDQAAQATLDPTPAIAACDAGTYGDTNALACITRAVRMRVDPGAAIAACDNATYGDEGLLVCLDSAAAFRYPPAATIAACDAATYGDPSLNACVAAASRYPADASATIQACDAATYGDDQLIACVQRGGAY